jgi:hypothetical protein
MPDAHSHLPDPGHECFRQSGAKHRPGAVCRRSVSLAALVVLSSARPLPACSAVGSKGMSRLPLRGERGAPRM